MLTQTAGTALVLGGTHDHIRLVQLLKEQGYRVILADYLEAPPAAQHCDRHARVSIVDRDAVLELAVGCNARLVIGTSVDPALATMAYVAGQMGTPCHVDMGIADLVANKATMKDFLLKHGIPTASCLSVDLGEEFPEKWSTYPAVVKPADANSSKGVRKVLNRADAIEAMDQARRISRSGRVVVEEFMEGRELSIDVLITDGLAEVIMISENIKSRKNKDLFTIVEGRYSPELEAQLLEPVQRIAQAITSELGLRHSALLVQCITDGTDTRVIEFTTRLGGGSKHHFIKAVTGVDILAEFLALICNEKVDRPRHPVEDRPWAALRYLYGVPGVVVAYEGFDEAKHSGAIENHFLYKPIGTHATGMIQSGDRLAGLLCLERSAHDLEQRIHSAMKSVHAFNAQGTDLIIR